MTEDTGHHSGPVTAARGGVTDARVAAADICADLRAGELLDRSLERVAAPEARAGAREICPALRAGELLDPSFERRVESLDARDRRWTQELLYGMLRRRAWLDWALSGGGRG